ncbi:MAG: Rpn family recombination-promoting nuclease/putative transposase, partial [Planctomycetota bacterium JB042]
MEPSPHDRFARRAFADLDVMRAHLRGFLPPELAARLDLSALRREPDVHLDPELRERLSDLLFAAPTVDGGEALVWFLFEHKSAPDRFLPYDLLRSAARIGEAWRREHPDATRLPWIVPVVLHAGARPFAAPRRYAALCGADGADGDDPVLGPDLRYVLTDLSSVADDAIRDRVGDVAFAALAHLLLKHARADDLLERLARWSDAFRAVLRAPTGLDALRTLLTYVLSVREGVTETQVARVVVPHLDASDRETVMSEFKSTADVLREEGMAKGEARGRQSEAADKLLRLLRRRFDVPDALAARIDAAPLADLDRWFDRALDVE